MITQRTREVVEEDGHDHDGGLSLDPGSKLVTSRIALPAGRLRRGLNMGV